MGVKTLKFNNVILDQKTINKYKEPIDLLSVDLDHIVYLINLNMMTKVLNILLVT